MSNLRATIHKVALPAAGIAALLVGLIGGPAAQATSAEQLYPHSAGSGTVNVSPSDNLPANAVVNVSGSGWTANVGLLPGSTVQILQCGIDPANPPAPNNPPWMCTTRALAITDGTGAFGPVPVAVSDSFSAPGGVNVQCGTPLNVDPSAVQADCLVYVVNQSSASLSSAGHHLSFAGTPSLGCVTADVRISVGTTSTTLHDRTCL